MMLSRSLLFVLLLLCAMLAAYCFARQIRE